MAWSAEAAAGTINRAGIARRERVTQITSLLDLPDADSVFPCCTSYPYPKAPYLIMIEEIPCGPCLRDRNPSGHRGGCGLQETPGKATRWREYTFVLSAGLVTGLLGLVNDLLALPISTDYFIVVKGLPADSLPWGTMTLA